MIVTDDKDWTWVLERRCPECGFDATPVTFDRLPALIRTNAAAWPALLTRADVARRPSPDRWSALEYACHVRDVFGLGTTRLNRMLAEDGARFENWDQDAAAVEGRYDRQDPATVADELLAAADALAGVVAEITPDRYARTGMRSDGAVFTIESFGRYIVHDPIHHLADVERGNGILGDG